MSATTTNGKPHRKQLADQIDRFEKQFGDQCARLDTIIDAIADGLPAAVADACREGARSAVKDVLIEVLTNPELRALLAPASVPSVPAAPAEPAPEPKKPGLWARLKAKVAAVREALSAVPEKVKAAVEVRCKPATDAVAAIGKMAGEVLPWKRVLLVGAVIGLTVGVISLVVPDAIAATVSAVSTAIATVAVQTGMWLNRTARCFGLLN